MAENLNDLLNSNKSELESILNEYRYLEQSHKSLINVLKTNIQIINEFYDSNDGLIDNMALMATNAKKDMSSLKQAMEEQIRQIQKADAAVEELSFRYAVSKEEIVKVIPYLKKWAELNEEITKLKDRKNGGEILTAAEEERLMSCDAQIALTQQRIERMGSTIKDFFEKFKEGDAEIKQNVEEVENLENALQKTKDAQEDFNGSMEKGSKIAQSFKGGWFMNLLSGAWNIITDVAKKGAEKWLEVDQAAHDFGRSMGMSARDIDAHTTSLFANYGNMAKTLGMEFKDIYKFQTGYADATEKSIILTKEQVGSMAALSRNTGEEAISVASKNLDVFATSANATIDYLAKGTARAAMDGLNVKKFSDAFANNIKLASKFTFREGITGIQKMTLLSQKLKFNMESIGTAMDKFSSLEGALDAGAKLQVLGGSFAQNFGNPLEAMSEALLDGEAFTKRIIDSVSATAKFNSKTGELDLAPIDKLRLKGAAEALGVSYDELHNMATQSRKEEMIGATVKGKGLNEEQISYLTNKAQYNTATGKWHLTDASGQMLPQDISQMTAEDIDKARNTDSYEKILAADVSEIHDLLISKANDELSQQDYATGLQESINMRVGEILDGLPKWVQDIIAAIMMVSAVSGITGLLGNLGGKAVRGVGKLLSRGAKSTSWIGKATNATKLAWASGMRGRTVAMGKTAAARWSTKGISATAKYVGRPISYVTKPLGAVVKGGSKLLSKAAAPLLLLDAGLTGYNMYSSQQDYKKVVEEAKASNMHSIKEKAAAIHQQEMERNKAMTEGGIELGATALGATIGTFIAGPAGTIIGGGLGGLVGWGANLLGLGEAVAPDARSEEEIIRELMREGHKIDIVDSEGYVKEGEWDDKAKAANDEKESMQTHVGSIEKEVQDVNDQLNVTNQLLAANNVKGNGSVKSDVKTNTHTTISIADMKMNMNGEIKLTSDYNAGHIDIGKLFQDNQFRTSLKDFIASHAQVSPGSGKPINTNSTTA